MNEPWTHYAKWETADPESHMLYDSIEMKGPEQANPKRQNADSRLPASKKWEGTADGCGFSAQSDANILKLGGVDGSTILWMY